MLVDYVKKSAGSKPATLVIVHSSTSMGRDGIDDARERAKELGIKVVLVQQTKFVETDVSAYALAIRQAKPTHVIHHGYSFAVWPEIVRLVRDYGMDDVMFLGTVWQNERAKMIELKDVAEGPRRREGLERRHGEACRRDDEDHRRRSSRPRSRSSAATPASASSTRG